MSKVDKKLISLTLIFAMVFTIFSPLIVNAEESVPEGVIEFKDQGLYQSLKGGSVDKNRDGYITKEEMESVESLSFSSISTNPIKSLEDLKYAKNLRILTATVGNELTEYNLEGLDNLEYFKIDKRLSTPDENYEMEKENIKVSDKFFFSGKNDTYGTGTVYSVYGFSVEDEIRIKNMELYSLCDMYTIGFRNEIKIEDETVVKLAGSTQSIEGLKEGSTKITFTSNYMVKEVQVIVEKSDVEINNNPELENTDVTSKLIYDRVLTSNGDLWKVNSKDEVIKEDTNVSDFVYIRYYSGEKTMYVKLKADGNLNITGYTDYEEESDEPIIKNIQNVKQILVNEQDRVAYLNNDNKLYVLDLNLDTRQIDEKLITSDVEKAKGAFYVKNGATYYINGEKVADGEFTDAINGAVAIENDLYWVRDREYSYSEPTYSCKLVASDFESFADEQYYGAYYVYYKTTSGEIKNTDEYYWNNDVKYEYQILGYNTYYPVSLKTDNTLCRYNLEYLTHVKDYITINGYDEEMKMNNPKYIIAIREDGTIWTKDYETEISGFNKILSLETEELGNVDGDDEVTIKDVKLTLQYSLSKEELSEVQVKAADVNKDGKVDIKDVRLILQYSLDKISEF